MVIAETPPLFLFEEFLELLVSIIDRSLEIVPGFLGHVDGLFQRTLSFLGDPWKLIHVGGNHFLGLILGEDQGVETVFEDGFLKQQGLSGKLDSFHFFSLILHDGFLIWDNVLNLVLNGF